MSTSAPPLSLILGGCPILFLQFYRLLFCTNLSLPAPHAPHTLPLSLPTLPPAPALPPPQSRLPTLPVLVP